MSDEPKPVSRGKDLEAQSIVEGRALFAKAEETRLRPCSAYPSCLFDCDGEHSLCDCGFLGGGSS